MGNNPEAVLDTECRVKGRKICVSSMHRRCRLCPAIHAAVLVIAEKVSDHMLGNPTLRRQPAPDEGRNSMATQLGDGFDVGGIRLDRPFKFAVSAIPGSIPAI